MSQTSDDQSDDLPTWTEPPSPTAVRHPSQAAADAPSVQPAPSEQEIELKAAERLAFFSDAVVAIAITLLALELPVPEHDTGDAFFAALSEDRSAYISFLISFFVIAGHWVGHHRVFRHLASAEGLTILNLVWLLMIVLTPFATRVLSSGGDSDDSSAAFRFVFYAAIQVVADAMFVLMVYRVQHRNLAFPGTRTSLFSISYWRVGSLGVAFAISIPLVYVIGQLAFIAWIALPILGGLVGRVRSAQRAKAAERVT